MAERLVNVDRDTPMLLPPDLRQWVPEDDLVHFVINAVETMNLSAVSVNSRGSGSKQYPPRMMLALVIYCYANGVFGSRRVERLTYRDVAVRYLTGDTLLLPHRFQGGSRIPITIQSARFDERMAH